MATSNSDQDGSACVFAECISSLLVFNTNGGKFFILWKRSVIYNYLVLGVLLIGRWDMTIINGPPSLLIYKIIDFNKKKLTRYVEFLNVFNCFIIILFISIRITKAILKMHIIFQLHWQMIRFIIGLKVTLFVFKLMVGHQNCSMIAVELWFRVTISIPLLSGHFHDYQNVPTSFDRGMTK